MKEKCKKIFSKNSIEWINEKYLLFCVYLSLVLNLVIEIVSRHSLLRALLYLFKSPVMYLFNAMILFLFLGVGAMFKRRILYCSVMSVLLLTLGIVNGILLCFRTTPFAAVDFLLITAALRIVDLYLSPVAIVLILIAIVAVIAVCIFLGMKMPKYTGKTHAPAVIITAVAYAFSLIGLNHVLVYCGIATENFSNLADAYHNYGFPYCFTNSVINLGMEKPDDYNEETVGAIVEETLKEQLPVDPLIPATVVSESEKDTENETGRNPYGNRENDGETRPNIIFLQLESFFDPYEVIGLELSEDPIPFYRELLEDYSSGYLYVPSVGAGTANTEFEVLTGMDLDFFGPGEYPYKTILKSTTCESMAYNLKALGYATHAIHNNDGTFYDRHIIFSQLGFDTFTPIEYMYGIERNINGFAKDEILVEEITKALDATDGEDLIYSISVQAHGEYPSERMDDEEPIFIRYPEQSMEYAWGYYVNQIAEDDQFLQDLIKALEKRDEPTVLVLYGDHLPYMNLEASDLTNGVLTATQYVIWDNMGLEKEDMDLESYQLAAHVFEKVNISQGILTQIHQNCMGEEDYLSKLEVVQYDMLYGDHQIYGGVNPYVATQLQFGIDEIRINSVEEREDATYVYGEGFNEYSIVILNGEKLKTTYVEESLLLVPKTQLQSGDRIAVAQIGNDNIPLGYTKEYLCP